MSLGQIDVTIGGSKVRTEFIEAADATLLTIPVAEWDCGPIGRSQPTRGRKPGECVYKCVSRADFETLKQTPERATILGRLVLDYATRTGGSAALASAEFLDLEFVSGRLVDVKGSKSCAPSGGAQPCECPPEGPSWWWLVAIGVGGLWAGSRMR